MNQKRAGLLYLVPVLLAAAILLQASVGAPVRAAGAAAQKTGLKEAVGGYWNPMFREKPEKTINLLLIGQDHKPEDPGSRSDTVILCTICPVRKTMTLTSVLRDLYVEIPGHGKNRINAAYALGGPELLEKTLQRNLGILADGYAEVDFCHFAALMDLLGGVPMELRKDEAREINRLVPGSALREGSWILTGEQALVYSRIRRLDADADVSRTQRQRKVLEAIFAQYRAASFETLVEAMRQTLPMIHTDLSGREIFSIACTVLPMMQQLQVFSRQIPAPGTYRDLQVDAMAVLDADLQANRRILGEILCPGKK